MTPNINVENVETIVMACCTLHNFLCSSSTSRSVFTPSGSFDLEDTDAHSITPGAWRRSNEAQGIVSLNRQGSNRTSVSAKGIQTYFVQFILFNLEEGAVRFDSPVNLLDFAETNFSGLKCTNELL